MLVRRYHSSFARVLEFALLRFLLSWILFLTQSLIFGQLRLLLFSSLLMILMRFGLLVSCLEFNFIQRSQSSE